MPTRQRHTAAVASILVQSRRTTSMAGTPFRPDSRLRHAMLPALLLLSTIFPVASAHAQSAESTIRGIVGLRWSEERLDSVEVLLDGRIADTTDAIGVFGIRHVTVGQHVLDFRRIGFQPKAITLEARQGEAVELAIGLETMAVPLEPIVVEGRVLSSRFREVADRARQGWGEFIWRDQIEELGSKTLSQVLTLSRRTHMAPVKTNGFMAWTPQMGFGSRACTPTVYLDGTLFELEGSSIDEIVPPQFVEVIEVYRDAEIPWQFARQPTACGVIAIWKRQPGRKPSAPSGKSPGRLPSR
jgi:hypothetical protein